MATEQATALAPEYAPYKYDTPPHECLAVQYAARQLVQLAVTDQPTVTDFTWTDWYSTKIEFPFYVFEAIFAADMDQYPSDIADEGELLVGRFVWSYPTEDHQLELGCWTLHTDPRLVHTFAMQPEYVCGANLAQAMTQVKALLQEHVTGYAWTPDLWRLWHENNK